MEKDITVICAWCYKKIKRRGVWYDIPEEVARWITGKFPVSHGACPTCYRKEKEKILKMRGGKKCQ